MQTGKTAVTEDGEGKGKNMRISVAMATCNGARFITEQLDSIRGQSLPVDQVILRDDGSEDQTVEIVREYLETYGLAPAWRITQNAKRLGYGENFRTAVEETDGDYVFFCDQDDIWEPDRVELMIRQMENHKGILVLGSEFVPFTVDSDAPAVSRRVLKSFRGDGSLEHVEWSPAHVFIGSEGCTMCLRREFLEETKAYWYPGWAHDEYAWKLALCLDGCYILHSVTLRRRMHSGNVSKRKMRDLDKRIVFFRELQKSHEMTLRFAEDKGMSGEAKELLRRNIRATALRIELMEQRRLWNIIPLIWKYRDCYHSKKSLPVEFAMAVRGGSI